MIIKYSALTAHLHKKRQALYFIIGNDHYLLNDALLQIKKAWCQEGETDEVRLQLVTIDDWKRLQEEANSFSLFAPHLLINAQFEKKSLEKFGKDILEQYLANPNQRCVIIIQAPQIPAKHVQWLEKQTEATLIQVVPLSELALQQWVTNQLNVNKLRYEASIPPLIVQYTRGNMLACAQIIERLKLIYAIHQEPYITVLDIKEQLVDQCEFQLYELAEACLAANTGKAIHWLRQANNSQIEPALILWLLTQEIRQLIQLSFLVQQTIHFYDACNKLKIWSQRSKLYQKALARLSLKRLYQLLQMSSELDELIKTNQGQYIWQKFDKIILLICET